MAGGYMGFGMRDRWSVGFPRLRKRTERVEMGKGMNPKAESFVPSGERLGDTVEEEKVMR
jgi:hypothetical protein